MEKIVISVDTMGGDRGPGEIIQGCISAAKIARHVDIVLLGPEDLIKAELDKYENLPNIRIENALEVIGMDEEPAWAVRNKKQSSIVIGNQMVREGKAQAFLSAGNTGATMAAALLIMGRIPGISRPAIVITFPTRKRHVYLLDAGANADCKPENLLEFAIMADSYLRSVIKRENPSIGLLSIGEEKAKGNELSKEAFALLERSGLNFYGNVEGGDIPRGTTDIVICDGFTGNVVLKLSEYLVKEVFSEIKEIINSSISGKIAGYLLKPALKKMIKRLDHEEYGGMLLLGVNGVCIICHGSSSAKAIKNAVLQAARAVEDGVVAKIKEDLKGTVSVNG
ncbi:MAG: phosphate acyltransferase PlsX [Actinomycetota bacterium]|nr:phosphate acyltransferase PlsX [Actinomycetota bacterium]